MQIDWWTLGIQTVNFLVVIWLLSRFLYRPIKKVIEEREAADRAASEAAQKKVEEAEQTRRTYEAKLDQIAQEQQDRETAFHKELEQERAERLEDAKAEAAALLAEARERIETEKRASLQNLKGQIVDLSRDLARQALSVVANGDDALAKVTAYLDGLPGSELDDLQADVANGDAPIAVTSTRHMADGERTAWRDALVERFGPETRIDFIENPDLLAGVDLHFPHAVLRFSAADRLEHAAAELEV